jgi:hypothetical protein
MRKKTMKPKPILSIFFFVLLLGLVACTAAGGAEPTVEDSHGSANGEEAVNDVSTNKVAVDDCVEAEPGRYQMIASSQGVCFLYPDTYDVSQGEDGSLTLYVRSLLNTEAPLATIKTEALDGRSILEVIPDYPSDAELATMSLLTIELGGEQATVFDTLPGEEFNRRIIAVHEDRVIDIMIARIGAEYGAVGDQAEALYELITSTLQFIGVEPEAPLLAGPECPDAPVGTTLFTNGEDGFCLLLPDGYTVDDSLTTENGGRETAVYVGSPQDAAHARLFITVEDAGGRSLQDITSDKEAELEAAISGNDVVWSFGYMLDGVWANQFDQVPGQDLSRVLVLVKDGFLYTLTFVPNDAAAGDAYSDMQVLYDTVVDSFSFLWQPAAVIADERSATQGSDDSTWQASLAGGEWVAEARAVFPGGGGDYYRELVVSNRDKSISWTLVEETEPWAAGYSLPVPIYFTREGSQFYFTHQTTADGCGLFAGGSNLQQVDLGTGQVVEIAGTEGIGQAVSPDGATLALVRRTPEGVTLTLHDLLSGDEQQVPLLEEEAHQAGRIVWSPDGSGLVLTLAHEPCSAYWTHSIVQVDRVSLEQTILVERDERRFWSTEWLDDGIRLDNAEGNRWTLDLRSGQVTAH